VLDRVRVATAPLDDVAAPVAGFAAVPPGLLSETVRAGHVRVDIVDEPRRGVSAAHRLGEVIEAGLEEREDLGAAISHPPTPA